MITYLFWYINRIAKDSYICLSDYTHLTGNNQSPNRQILSKAYENEKLQCLVQDDKIIAGGQDHRIQIDNLSLSINAKSCRFWSDGIKQNTKIPNTGTLTEYDP